MQPAKKRWAWSSALVLGSAVLLAPHAAAVAPPLKPPPPRQLPPPLEAKEQKGGPLDRPTESKKDGGPLDRPVESPPDKPVSAPADDPYGPVAPFTIPRPVTPGFTGRSGVAPVLFEGTGHFVPVEDRWRSTSPSWDRYDRGFPLLEDYPYNPGHWYDPYRQNVLKGDYAIFGQNTFFEFAAISNTLYEPRQIPTATTPFESTTRPGQFEFFGSPNQSIYQQNFTLSFDLFHGDVAFKPVDWRIKFAPVFNINVVSVQELAVINPDIRKGTQRERTFAAPFQEFFVEKKIADLSPNYDFVSVRAGTQFFVSDFRGFLFSDINRAVRIFGNTESNRNQFNLAYFNQIEKDTNSQLNSFRNRQQQVYIANFFRQDFIWPGYQVQASVHYNHDNPSFKFDRNNNLVRPDPVGTFRPKGLDVVYLGLASDGHINRFNVTSQLYWALGRDGHNNISNAGNDINALMAAIELSYDRDYVRFRNSYFYASGDGNPNNGRATGFDTILDRPNFAGTQFSYWQRQRIPLFGVGLKQELSLIPNLRSSKTQGQSNFVNPGLHLFNVGLDIDVTPKLKLINNWNLLWFDKTASLETFLFQGKLDTFIGGDLSLGVEYRPLLSNNVVMTFGLATLIPGQGFKDLYDRLNQDVGAMVAAFGQMIFAY